MKIGARSGRAANLFSPISFIAILSLCMLEYYGSWHLGCVRTQLISGQWVKEMGVMNVPDHYLYVFAADGTFSRRSTVDQQLQVETGTWTLSKNFNANTILQLNSSTPTACSGLPCGQDILINYDSDADCFFVLAKAWPGIQRLSKPKQFVGGILCPGFMNPWIAFILALALYAIYPAYAGLLGKFMGYGAVDER